MGALGPESYRASYPSEVEKPSSLTLTPGGRGGHRQQRAAGEFGRDQLRQFLQDLQASQPSAS
jgi:hypothetical protein